MRFFVAVLLLAFTACKSAAPAVAAEGSGRPTLLVVIVVDQFSADLFNQYRPHFTGGLKRLSTGIVYPNGYQAHGVTETCPGHAVVATGSYPTRNGIVSNAWVDPSAARTEKTIYCAEDERSPAGSGMIVSSVHLKVPTLGEWMKKTNPASRVVAVAGKDRSAVMLGGGQPDELWWWDKTRFVSNRTKQVPFGELVNSAIGRGMAQARPPLVPPAYCADKDRAIPIGSGKSVGNFRFDRKQGDAEAFTDSPELDAATLAMAAALVQQLRLGHGPAPDVLDISLSATDFVGHRYGSGGVEMCLQLASLDSDLGAFLTVLDRSGIDYAVALTADHGGLDLPERLQLLGDKNAQRLKESASAGAVSKEVAKRLGITGAVFEAGWYFAADLPAARRPAAIAAARALLAAESQVEAVYSAEEIASRPVPNGDPAAWSVPDRLRASFDPQRSPALFVVYKPEVTPIVDPTQGYVATHGSVWDYDRKVPILFWWNGAQPEDRPQHAMTVDIAPTLAGLIGVFPPGPVDGHCLVLPTSLANCPP